MNDKKLAGFCLDKLYKAFSTKTVTLSSEILCLQESSDRLILTPYNTKMH